MSSLNQLPAARETAYNLSAPPRIISVHRDFGPQQHQILSCDRRFIFLAAGRRWGKTTLGLFMLLCYAASARGQLCYYVGPTERQAKEMGWRTLKQLVPPVLLRRMRESELEIELVNGSIIKVHGPQSLRGTRARLRGTG